MAPITVYRALDFLIEQGLAYRLASHNAYIAGSGTGRTTAFLVCEGCGEAAAIASPDVADTVPIFARFARNNGLCGGTISSARYFGAWSTQKLIASMQ